MTDIHARSTSFTEHNNCKSYYAFWLIPLCPTFSFLERKGSRPHAKWKQVGEVALIDIRIVWGCRSENAVCIMEAGWGGRSHRYSDRVGLSENAVCIVSSAAESAFNMLMLTSTRRFDGIAIVPAEKNSL